MTGISEADWENAARETLANRSAGDRCAARRLPPTIRA